MLPTQADIMYHTLNKSSCSMLCLLTLYLWIPGEGCPPSWDISSKLSGDKSLLGSPSTLRRSDTFICAVAWPIGSPSWNQTSHSYQNKHNSQGDSYTINAKTRCTNLFWYFQMFACKVQCLFMVAHCRVSIAQAPACSSCWHTLFILLSAITTDQQTLWR